MRALVLSCNNSRCMIDSWLKTKANVRSAACLGEHTHYMCTELLGISDEESVKLIRDEVLA